MDKHGNIIMPTNTANVWMSEPELVGLFGVIARQSVQESEPFTRAEF